MHNYDARGPTDSLESAVCRGREPKIAASDCHTIGLGCTVQLCFRASVCHLTDCRAAANLSGVSWLESGLLLLPASDGKDGSPTPSSKTGSEGNEEEKKPPPTTTTHKLVYKEQAPCSDSLSSSSKCVQFLISILPQWHSSKRGDVQLQI